MSEEQTQRPSYSEVRSAASSTVFEEDPKTDCDCPARRRFEPTVVMAPDQAFDEWKSQRKIRRYHPEVGVKHTWRSMKSTFSVRHVLDKEG